jgi:branched-chain amino acid transport system permease protein
VTLLNIIIDGLSYGMVLFIIAIGMTITLGLMRFVNLAHGAFAMIGGYITAYFIQSLGVSFWLALPFAVLITATLGALTEHTILRHLYARDELSQVLFTIGLAFFIIASTNALFGQQVQLIKLPPVLAQTIDLGFRILPMQRVFVIFVGVMVAIIASLLMVKTRFGIWLRAAVDNAEIAGSLGVPLRLVQCLTFAIGCGLAGLGGVLGAELMPLEPYYALKYLVLVLVVVAVGGMGSIAGTLTAAITLGIIETASKYYASQWGSLFFFLAMALLLVWRPQGILRGVKR